MENDFQKNNEQVNDTNTNPPVEQNNVENNANQPSDNQQTSYSTYSALPGIFNNQNTVSQNRNVPPVNRPANRPVNRPVNRPNPNLRQPNPNNPVPNQQVNNNTQNRDRVSEGRAFAQEFYSQPNSQNRIGNERPPMNGQARPNQPMGNERPQMNGQFRPNQPMGNERPQMNGQVRPNNPMDNEKPEAKVQDKTNNTIGSEKPEVKVQDKPTNPIVNEKPQMNPLERPNKFVAGEESKVNYAPAEAENKFDFDIPNNDENKPKRDVKYNYEALTPPDKKATSKIIVVYVIVVLLLLVGVIGYFAATGASKSESGFSDFFEKMGLDKAFSENSDKDYSEEVSGYIDYIDEGYSEDVSGDIDYSGDVSVDINSMEDYDSNSTALNLRYSNGASDFEEMIIIPGGYDIRRDEEKTSLVIFDSFDRTVTCQAELLEGSSSDEARLKELMDFSGKSYISARELSTYQTGGEYITLWQVEYDNRIETYAFIDVDSNMMLSIYMRKHNLAGDINNLNCEAEMHNLLDNMFY